MSIPESSRIRAVRSRRTILSWSPWADRSMLNASTAIWLPGALSVVTSSNSLSCASAGRYVSSPSASQAVGSCGVEPRIGQRRRPVVAQVDRDRDAMRPSGRRRAPSSVEVLYSSTLGWSISNTVVPAGQSSR